MYYINVLLIHFENLIIYLFYLLIIILPTVDHEFFMNNLFLLDLCTTIGDIICFRI